MRGHSNILRLLSAFLALLSLAFFTLKASWGQEPPPGPFAVQKVEGRPAPDFTLEDLEGKEMSLRSLRGKTVVLHFWASWCEPCKKETPALSKLSESFKGKGLTIIAVSEDSRERVRQFKKEYRMDFPVLVDQYGGVMRAYKVLVIPVSVVIDRDGFIEGVITGERDYSSPEAMRYFQDILK